MNVFTQSTFLRWLQREAYVEHDLCCQVEMPKVPKYQDVAIDLLSDREIAHLAGPRHRSSR